MSALVADALTKQRTDKLEQTLRSRTAVPGRLNAGEGGRHELGFERGTADDAKKKTEGQDH